MFTLLSSSLNLMKHVSASEFRPAPKDIWKGVPVRLRELGTSVADISVMSSAAMGTILFAAGFVVIAGSLVVG
jgi:hypothetical protein